MIVFFSLIRDQVFKTTGGSQGQIAVKSTMRKRHSTKNRKYTNQNKMLSRDKFPKQCHKQNIKR